MLFKILSGKCQFTYAILCALLWIFTPAQAMIYRPEKGHMWDPSVIWHDGKYYSFMMYSPTGGWRYCFVATSTDGVHWKDQGTIIEEREYAAKKSFFFKCFVARCGDKFIMNHGVEWSSEGYLQDTLRFYESRDLKNWNYLFSSQPDTRWYTKGDASFGPYRTRWDHMYVIPKEQGAPEAGYWGYAVATPKPGLPRGPGMMQSLNGTDWEVLPPAEMKWGDTPQKNLEYGGCERIGGKYYLIGGMNSYVSKGYSMYTLVSDGPRGPFRPDTEAYRLCGTTRKKDNVTWLAAWARAKGELLISNYVSFPSDMYKPWMLPLRRPVVDKDGHLRLGWWKGNEALKGKPFKLKKKTVKLKTQPKKNNYKIVYLSEEFDLDKGLVLEGRIKARSAVSKRDSNDTASKMKPAAGFVFEEGPGKSMAIQLGIGKPEDRETHIGILETSYEEYMQFQSEDVTGGKGCATVTGINSDKEHRFRLLVRRGMFELYIDDMLMQTYVYEPGSGKVGFLAHNANVVFRDVQAWNMSF